MSRNHPTHTDLAKTAKRLQSRQPAEPQPFNLFGRGEHAKPTPAVQEVKRAPKPGTVVVGMSATRILAERASTLNALTPVLPAGTLIDDYEQLKRALNERRMELKLTILELDTDAGLQDGYAAKCFCGDRNFGPKTLWPVIDALGLRMVLVPAVPASAGTVFMPCEINGVDVFQQERLKKIASLGGKARRAKMSGPQRRIHGVSWCDSEYGPARGFG
jgi:hypothetical protein